MDEGARLAGWACHPLTRTRFPSMARASRHGNGRDFVRNASGMLPVGALRRRTPRIGPSAACRNGSESAPPASLPTAT